MVTIPLAGDRERKAAGNRFVGADNLLMLLTCL